jgi:hypothetical protein
VRPAESERHSETLGGAHADIGAEFTRGAKDREGEDVGRDDDERAGGMGFFGERLVVLHRAVGVGILQQDARDLVVELEFLRGRHLDLDAKGLRAGGDDLDRLGMAVFGHEEDVPAVLHREAEVHGLGGGGAFVEERGVGDLESGEIADHGLEVEERFEPALGDLGLIRGVLGVPAGVFQDVALDDGGSNAAVVAEADVGTADDVLGGDGAELIEGVELGLDGWNGKRGLGTDDGGNGGGDQPVEGIMAEGFQHSGRLGRVGPDMTGEKLVGVGQPGVLLGSVQGRRFRHQERLGRAGTKSSARKRYHDFCGGLMRWMRRATCRRADRESPKKEVRSRRGAGRISGSVNAVPDA